MGIPGALMAGYLVELPILGRRGTLAIFTGQSAPSIQIHLSVIQIVYSSNGCLHSLVDNGTIVQFLSRMGLWVQLHQ